jgi:hypothetical protein
MGIAVTIRTAVVAVALVPALASSTCDATRPAPATSRVLVTYREQQGGIVYRLIALSVSADRRAILKSERCTVRFHVSAALWHRLKAALKQTDPHAIAGNYGPATPRADESTWVITVGPERVRIHDFSISQAMRAKLEPLLKVLLEVLSVGERRAVRLA